MGPSRLQSFFAILVAVLCTLATRTAGAQPPSPRASSIHLLEVDTEDSDDQAEALTAALRSRLHASTGWTLFETTQSLSMLTAALRCPSHPDAACLTRIADQLKADRFIWGLMSKTTGHQVIAELHFWTRGKPERVAKETYSDNLKDQNDDALQKIAGGLVDRLLGAPTATLEVTAATEEGAVFVDGEQRGQLDHGKVSLDVPAGTHVVEVRTPSFNAKQSVNVVGGTTTEVSFAAETAHASRPSAPEAAKPFAFRKVAEWATVGAGVVLLAVSLGELKGYLDAQNSSDPRFDAYRSEVNGTESVGQACSQHFVAPGAGGGPGSPYDFVCNTLNAQAVRDSTLTYVFGGLGAVVLGTGIVLVLTDHQSETGQPPPQTSVHFVPQVSPRGGGFGLVGTF